MKEIKCFGIVTGKSRVEFSVWQVHNGYEARVNDIVICRTADYSLASEMIQDGMESNTIGYIGGMTH